MLVRLFLRRLVLSGFTMVLVSMLIFGALEILPGDVASRNLGRFATEEQKAEFRQKMHLDLPVEKRYLNWIGHVIQGDFGRSLSSDRPVAAIIGPRLRNTLMLATFSFLLSLPITFLLAVISAMTRGNWPDSVISVFTLVGLSTPEFLMGTIVLIMLAVRLPLFPTMSTLESVTNLQGYLRTAALPAMTLAIVTSVYGIRMLRDNLIEVLSSDFIKMAQLKGLSASQVAWRHALPNAVLPTLNVSALNLAYLIGGVVVVERVFVYPGMGDQLISAIELLDLPVVEGIVLIVSLVYVLANLAADVLGILLTPRLRAG